MKKRFKINRGLLLSVIALIGVIIYIVAATASETASTEKITSILEKYLPIEVKYSMLPEEYRSPESEIPAEVLEKYISDMKNDISAFFAGDGENEKELLETLEESLRAQAENKELRLSDYSKVIDSIDVDYESGGIANASVNTDIRYSYCTNSVTSESHSTSDTVNLKKVGGEWKLTYSFLANPSFFNAKDYYGYDDFYKDIMEEIPMEVK